MLSEVKVIGLDMISPTWSRRLCMLPVQLPTKIKWYLDLHDKGRCVVGEAYGMSSKYVDDCHECNKFSLDFESHFIQNKFAHLERTKELFIQHWNERHSDITTSLGNREPLRWYDSFLRFDDHIQTSK